MDAKTAKILKDMKQHASDMQEITTLFADSVGRMEKMLQKETPSESIMEYVSFVYLDYKDSRHCKNLEARESFLWKKLFDAIRE